MGKMSILLPDDLERRFRMRVLERMGSQKGALSTAMAKAVELWLEKTE